jgi:hypothetical protein
MKLYRFAENRPAYGGKGTQREINELRARGVEVRVLTIESPRGLDIQGPSRRVRSTTRPGWVEFPGIRTEDLLDMDPDETVWVMYLNGSRSLWYGMHPLKVKNIRFDFEIVKGDV